MSKINNLLLFLLVLLHYHCNNSEEGRIKNFKAHVGEYMIDMSRTDLETYAKDSNIYRGLKIIFFEDSSFKLNMNVPFLHDSLGTWVAGNMNEWNWMEFKSFSYSTEEWSSGTQFTRLHDMNGDSIFLINAATPQDGENTISTIYFKKIK